MMSHKALINSELSQLLSPENGKTIHSPSIDVINSDTLLMREMYIGRSFFPIKEICESLLPKHMH